MAAALALTAAMARECRMTRYPAQLYYSAAGVGTNPHIAGDSSTLLADVNIAAVQFKGGGPADRRSSPATWR